MSDKKIILLIEDNLDDAVLTIRAFKKNNVNNEIVHLKDGISALDYLFGTGEYAGKEPNAVPSLILLDINMPKMDGLEVLKRIKAEPTTQWIPTIMLSSSKEEKDLEASYMHGANSYIHKPVNFEDFFAAVEKLETYWLKLNELPSQN